MAQLTMLVTALVHRIMPMINDSMQHNLGGHIKSIDKKDKKRLGDYKFKDHVVIVGFNETGLEIAEHFRELGQDIVVIDLDWKLHQTFSSCYKGATASSSTPRDLSMSPTLTQWPYPVGMEHIQHVSVHSAPSMPPPLHSEQWEWRCRMHSSPSLVSDPILATTHQPESLARSSGPETTWV